MVSFLKEEPLSHHSYLIALCG